MNINFIFFKSQLKIANYKISRFPSSICFIVTTIICAEALKEYLKEVSGILLEKPDTS